MPKLECRVELVGHSDSDWAGDATSSDTAAAVAEHLSHTKTVLECFGLETHVKNQTRLLCFERSAAKEDRRGHSSETRVLWLQHAVRERLIELETVPSDDNPADLGTKTLRVHRLWRRFELVAASISTRLMLWVESQNAVRTGRHAGRLESLS